MKIVFVSPIKVYPPTSGAALRIISMMQHLSRMGHEVAVINISTPLISLNLSPPKILNEDNMTVIFSHFLNLKILRQLLLADIAQFEYPYLLHLMIILKFIFRKRFIIDEHGVESIFIKELKKIPSMPKTPRSIGFLLKKTPGLSAIIPALEKFALRISDLVFVCSKRDSAEIQRMYGINPAKIVVVPNCAQSSLLNYENVTSYSFGRPTILFLGSYEHPPNVEAAWILLNSILPRVREKNPNVLFVFVGRSPPKWLTKENSGNVLVTGEIQDIRPLMRGADITVAPIFSGSGTRTKIVEYMMMGKPIVSSSKGVEGLGIQDRVHFLESDTVEGFSEAIIYLLKNKAVAKRLGDTAQKFAKQHFAWNKQIKKVLHAYKTLF